MIDSSLIAVAYSYDGTNSQNSNQATNSVIEECKAGEHVWVSSDCEADSGVHSGRFAIFSGFLIH